MLLVISPCLIRRFANTFSNIYVFNFQCHSLEHNHLASDKVEKFVSYFYVLNIPLENTDYKLRGDSL